MPSRLATEVMTAAGEPVYADEEGDEAIDGAYVVHICSVISHSHTDRPNTPTQQNPRKEEKTEGENSLPPRTGFAGGKEYITSVNAVQASSTIFAKRPRRPIQKGPWGMVARPRRRRQRTGME